MKQDNLDLKVSMEAYSLLAEWVKNHLPKNMIFRIGDKSITVITKGTKHTFSLVGINRELSQKAYSNLVIDHMADYKSLNFPNLPKGIYRGGAYNHILPATKEQQYNTVWQYNTIESVRGLKMLLRPEVLHMFAHHLNSSQMMCYNFFRPYLNDRGIPNENLFSLLNTVGINIPYDNNAAAKFEYEQAGDEWSGEKTNGSKGTNFDFYLKAGCTEVFFEIKYTEKEFGTYSITLAEKERHRKKYDSFYGEKIKNCPALKRIVPFSEDFRLNYQLLRNTIRVTNKNKYAVFVYDANNPHTFQQVHAFLEACITDEYKQNVIALEWQKLLLASNPDNVYEFAEKYLSYKLTVE